MEIGIIILLFFGVIVITGVVFALWVLVGVLRFIFRGISAIVAPLPKSPAGLLRSCTNVGCGALNPPAASFCRRCGRVLHNAQPVPARRAG